MGTRGSFPKAAGREADHSPPSSAKVKECVELYLHGVVIIKKKQRDNFTYYIR